MCRNPFVRLARLCRDTFMEVRWLNHFVPRLLYFAAYGALVTDLQIAVLADTHIPKRAKTLPDSAWKIINSADVILHAGDVLSEEFLGRLSSVAPLYVVRGNNDVDLGDLPETLEFSLEDIRFAMIHDSGPKRQRAARMRQRFPNADVVIFGHSHIPIDEYEDALLLFNPGSPTDRRTQPELTMGLLEVTAGKIIKAEIIALPKS